MNADGVTSIVELGRYLLAAVLTIPLGVGCDRTEPPARSGANVLLLTIDTTRADALGCYGGRIAATPALDALARRGVRFDTAVAPVSATLPTHATLMTGVWPFGHGVRDNGIFRLGSRAETLAECLAGAGYATGAVVSAFVLDSQFGLDQGFEQYDDQVSSRVWLAAGLQDRRAEEVTDRGLEFIDNHPEGPFFLWLHYFDPHGPYDPPQPFASRYAETPYHGEVAYMDSHIGRLIDGLSARSRLDDTIVVVAADHGESLGQHGEATHGYFIYDATVRVPLLISGPDIPANRVVGGTSRLIDVMPTILDLLGVAFPDSVQGTSLVPYWIPEGAAPPALTAYLETYVPYYNFAWCPLEGLRDARWKYIRAPRPELYDLETDPGEQHNVIGDHPEVVQRMSGQLDRIKQHAGTTLAEEVQVTSSEVERLAALGYTASAAAPPDFTGPDPKDVIHLLALRQRGHQLLERRRFEEAIAVFRQILEQNPSNAQVRGFVGAALAARGQWAEARAELETAVTQRPSLFTCQYTLGLCYGKLGDRAAMKKHFLAALAHNRNYIEPARDLAVLSAEEGDAEEVAHYLALCREILAGRPTELARVEQLIDEARGRAASHRSPGGGR